MDNQHPTKKIAIVVGTRPEIIKMAPIIRYCEREKIRTILIHTGQHYSYDMDRIFFHDLKLPEPSYNLEVGSHSHGKQTGLLLMRLEEVLIEEKPSIVLVEGDTNSVLAGGLISVKMGIPVGHVEAGLRSYDREMPEELNRVLVDHLSSLLFAPTEPTQKILLNEGISQEKIYVTGNTIVDAVHQNLSLIDHPKEYLEKLDIHPREYMILTLHRQENVDNANKLSNVFSGLELVHSEFKMPILYPIHPRTRKRISQFQVKVPSCVILSDPLGYLSFLGLFNLSRLVLTDSGGIQEEACILKIPSVTLRENTERPETLEVGSNILAGTDPHRILESTRQMMKRECVWENPFGDGSSAQQIIQIVMGNI